MADFIPNIQELQGAAGPVHAYVEDDGGIVLIAEDDFYRSKIAPDESMKMALEILERRAMSGLAARVKTGT